MRRNRSLVNFLEKTDSWTMVKHYINIQYKRMGMSSPRVKREHWTVCGLRHQGGEGLEKVSPAVGCCLEVSKIQSKCWSLIVGAKRILITYTSCRVDEDRVTLGWDELGGKELEMMLQETHPIVKLYLCSNICFLTFSDSGATPEFHTFKFSFLFYIPN